MKNNKKNVFKEIIEEAILLNQIKEKDNLSYSIDSIFNKSIIQYKAINSHNRKGICCICGIKNKCITYVITTIFKKDIKDRICPQCAEDLKDISKKNRITYKKYGILASIQSMMVQETY